MTNMDLMAILSTVVLGATIITTLFAVAAYAVSRGYTKKKKTPKGPPTLMTHAARQPILKRYNPYNVNA